MALTPKNWKTFQHYSNRTPSWIKLHKRLLDDFAFTRLPIASKALAPLLWLLASEYPNGTITCSDEEIAFRLRWSDADFALGIKPLIAAGFFVVDSAMLADCEQDACLEEEKEEKREEEDAEADASKTASSDFVEFWKLYPERDGSNPAEPAERAFKAAVSGGVAVADIMTGLRAFRVAEAKNIGTEFIPQAQKWLRDRRWKDYLKSAATAEKAKAALATMYYAQPMSPQLDAWDAHSIAIRGKTLPRDGKGGWYVEAEWPPGHRPSTPPPRIQTMQ